MHISTIQLTIPILEPTIKIVGSMQGIVGSSVKLIKLLKPIIFSGKKSLLKESLNNSKV